MFSRQNLKGIKRMRHAIKGLKVVILGVAGLGLGFMNLEAADTVVKHVWNFGSAANPALSESSQATASIRPGKFSAGWQKNLAVLTGSEAGLWDLGQEGKLTFVFPNGVGENGQVKSITIKVSQWWDGGIYDDLASVSLPGATETTTGATAKPFGDLGGWIVDTSSWQPKSGETITSLALTAGKKGAVIDSVVVEATVGVIAAPQLSIRFATPNQAELSWPVANSNMILETSSDLSDSASWHKVEGTVSVGESVCSLSVEVQGPGQFYRLRQP
jgi:hypothetical protein